MKNYYIYIMASRAAVLYTGFTGHLKNRILQHKTKQADGFTKKYNVNRLIYFEVFSDVNAAIAREKQVKAYRREKKVALIDSVNPDWRDLSEEWYDDFRTPLT